MNKPFAGGADISLILNQFSESTGGYYYYYDFQEHLLHLSKNFQQAAGLFSIEQVPCTLVQWRKGIDPHDLDRVTRIMDDLISRKIRHYSVNYRVLNVQGRSCWVNSCGNSFCNEKGQLSYLLGQLTVGAPIRSGKRFNGMVLKGQIEALISDLQPGYLLLVGVDNLKAINIRDGRNFGDAVLEDVARVLEDEKGINQPVYSLNGDSFALNLPGWGDAQVTDLFTRVQERLAGHCTVSGGCVSYLQYHVTDGGTLLQYAETALDCSKSQGKNTLTFFTPEIYESKLQALELLEDLKASIQDGFRGFQVYYQPQFRVENLTLYGAEALLRYCSPRRGLVPTSEMIATLEESGLICTVGLWALREALRQCRSWRAILPQFHISVNMSYRQLEEPSIEEEVLDLVSTSGVPGNALTIEITESMELSDYPQLNHLFRRWRKHGIEISIDDFGTGYSSLGRLKNMSIDEIKIDRCFVNGLQDSAYNYRLLNNILDLAEADQVRSCCEGVETPEELRILRELHCSLVQGYLFASPCSPSEFEGRFLSGHPDSRLQALRAPLLHPVSSPFQGDLSEDQIAQVILNAENDIIYLCDLETYQLYYLNAAGQQLFGVHDYRGKTCYKVLRGRNTPCPFCNNKQLIQNSFSLWEQENPYCQRHFLLKDRIIPFQGRKARLEVGIDITKGELVSQAARERLEFAARIVEYMNTLSDYYDYQEAVNRVLASVGDFYQADRAYLFQPSAVHPNHWANTFEWCAVNVSPEKEHLQDVSEDDLSRWLELFQQNKSVILFNLEPLRTACPGEWRILHSQGIQRIIAVPLRHNQKTIGFIGVDNPRYCIHDDSQIRVLAAFLLTRMRQDQNEQRYRALVTQTNRDLFRSLKAGFWTLEIELSSGLRQMMVSDSLGELLALPDFFSPKEIYHFWFSRILASEQQMVEEVIQEMIHTGQLAHVTFHWAHDHSDPITLLFCGLLVEDAHSRLRLAGYCRLLESSSTNSQLS